jgi:hypothetical protein
LVCLLCSARAGWADSKWFYEDGTIQEGEVYSYVGVYNDAEVNMTGGDITDQLTAWNTSTVNLWGGFVQGLVSVDSSSLNLLGNIEINGMEVHGSSVLNMNDGTVGVMEIDTLGGAYLRNGVISDYLLANSTINIYGYGFAYDAGAGAHGGGQLTGFWGNGTPFSFDLYAINSVPGAGAIDTWPYISLHEIPEPVTLVLFVLGTTILPRKR